MSSCPSTQLGPLWRERGVSPPWATYTARSSNIFQCFPHISELYWYVFNLNLYQCRASSLTASKASWCPSGFNEGTRWMRIPSTSRWALGFLSLYSLHRYCIRSRIISRPTASFPWRPAVKRNSGSPVGRQDNESVVRYLCLHRNVMTSTWNHQRGFQT